MESFECLFCNAQCRNILPLATKSWACDNCICGPIWFDFDKNHLVSLTLTSVEVRGNKYSITISSKNLMPDGIFKLRIRDIGGSVAFESHNIPIITPATAVEKLKTILTFL